MHRGIDGYRRVTVYLKVASRTGIVFTAFLEAISHYGLPSHVRADCGRGNVEVDRFMLAHPERGPQRGSFISGRSVHNQRIEHFGETSLRVALILLVPVPCSGGSRSARPRQ